MRKWLALLCCGVCLLTLTACGEKNPTASEGGDADAAARKIGLGCVNTATMMGTTENRLKVTVAALVLDKDGKIEDCQLDELDFTVSLKDGEAQSPAAALTTKGEKGDAYTPTKEDTGSDNSLSASWEDQAEAFCDFAEGKTVGEITGLATTDGKSEKVQGCDLILTDFIQAIERASKMAKAHDIGADDDLHLAVVAAEAQESTTDKPRYDVELAAVTLDEKERITGCMTDSVQMKLTVTDGVFTTLSGPVESKRQAGDGYGMKEASAIKREWYEQADAFDTFARGKTAAELTATATDAEGRADAVSGCTISVTGMVKSAAKAAQD